MTELVLLELDRYETLRIFPFLSCTELRTQYSFSFKTEAATQHLVVTELLHIQKTFFLPFKNWLIKTKSTFPKYNDSYHAIVQENGPNLSSMNA
jgi:hypothetical protein